MSTLLSRFTFDPTKVNYQIWLMMLFVWLVVLACGIGSVYSLGPQFNRKQRVFWILIMVCLPLFGLLAYLPFSVKREGFTLMRQTKNAKRGDRRENAETKMLKG